MNRQPGRGRRRVLRQPRLIVAGQPASGWLGLVSSWLLVGFGVASASLAGARLLTVPEGACQGYSATVCAVAGWGGLLMGFVAIAVGTLASIAIARGFGPPVIWWVLPAMLFGGAVTAVLTAVAGTDAVPLPWLLAAGALIVVALALAAAALQQGRAALLGWIRLDGLDAREVPMRSVELLLPLAAIVACSAGAAFGDHVIRLLAET